MYEARDTWHWEEGMSQEGCAMRRRKDRRRMIAAAGLTAGLLAGSNGAIAQIPCGYDVQIIQGPWCGEIFGYPPTVAKGISDSGAVVGHYTSCLIGPSEAFIWIPGPGLIALDRPSGFSDAGAEDTDSVTGWIVGSMRLNDSPLTTATLWIESQATDLGTLPGGNFSHAFGINNGRIVGKWGNSITDDPGLQAFLWEEGKMTDLAPDLGTPRGWAWDINSLRQITGWMGTAPQTDARAFIWDAGKVTELPPIPGGFTSEGRAMNARGDVAGVGRWIDPKTGEDLPRAFLWHDGKMTNLGTLPGFTKSGASDLTEATVVIGTATAPGALSAGFIWYQDVIVDVNTLIDGNTSVEVTACSAINRQGQIAAVGHDARGDVIALLLTPAEPPLGDLDMDCAVGASDLLILLTNNWGPCGDCADCPADLNGDCNVGVSDLLILLANWG